MLQRVTRKVGSGSDRRISKPSTDGSEARSSIMKTVFARFIKDQSGATAIEYGLIAAIIGVGIITVLGFVKTELNTTFTKVETALKTANQ